ncbi:MAG: hypothetical protein CMB99_03455 [Flavobacteriaceae bacterium]|nr:hypothetical protein [Flavobacteriaceae bacterium]
MKFIYVKRKHKQQKYYSKKMGMLNARVTTIKKYLLGIPLQTLHRYRETYYGEMKSCKECSLSN